MPNVNQSFLHMVNVTQALLRAAASCQQKACLDKTKRGEAEHHLGSPSFTALHS